MKTKLKLLALLCAININVGAADAAAGDIQGELGIGYASEYFYRGEQIAEESTQLKAKLTTDVSVADAFICAFSNQGHQSTDSYLFAVGLADSYLNDTINAKVGWLHREHTPGEATSELFLSLGLTTPLEPTLTLSQDTDDSLTTGEISISHSFDLDIAELGLSGLAGSTETLAGDRNYYGGGAKLSKDLGGLIASVGVDYIDAEDVDSETVFSAGVSVKF